MLSAKTFWKLVFWGGVAAVCATSLMPPAHDPLTGVFDKWKHTASYFALMAASYPAYRAPRFELRIAAGLAALGIALEAVQGLQPQRFASLADAAANAAGIVLAVLAARGIERRRRARRTTAPPEL